MTNDERKYLLEETKRAQANGFEGSVLDVFRNPNILQEFQAQSVLQPTQGSNIEIAATPEQQQQGLRGRSQAELPAQMIFPNIPPNTPFNTVGMKAPINIEKYDEQGHLVKSYENVPPGIANLPMGPQRGTVIETPAAQSGGIIQPKGDPWEYQYKDGKYLTRRRGSENWITARGNALEAIKTKVYKLPPTTQPPSRSAQQPRRQEERPERKVEIPAALDRTRVNSTQTSDNIELIPGLNLNTPAPRPRQQPARQEPTTSSDRVRSERLPRFDIGVRPNVAQADNTRTSPFPTPTRALNQPEIDELGRPLALRREAERRAQETPGEIRPASQNYRPKIEPSWLERTINEASDAAAEWIDEKASGAKRVAGRILPADEESLIDVPEENIVIPTVENESVPVQETFKELARYPDEIKGNELSSFVHTFDNIEGGTYRVGPKVKELYSGWNKRRGAITTMSGAAVAHFLRDSDVSENQQFAPESWEIGRNNYEMKNMSKEGKLIGYTQKQMNDPERYRMMYRKNEDGTYSIKYKKLKDIGEGDAEWSYDLPVSRQHRFSDIDWDKKGKSTGYQALGGRTYFIPLKPDAKDIDSEKGIAIDEETGLNHTSIPVGKGNEFSRFSGGSVVFLFTDPKTGREIGIDVSGSKDVLRDTGRKLIEQYGLKEEDITVAYHDMGSYSAKPASKDGKLDYDQWINFNAYNRGFSGAPLIIANQQAGGIKKYKLGGVRKYQSGNSKMSSITPTTVAPPKFDLNRFKKGVSYVESKDGKYMMNPNSSATGLYGQLYNEVKDLPELKNIDRNAFAADTALQNKILGLRVQGKIPGIPGIEKAAKDLYNEYSTQISNFPYDVTEVGALVNFLGRQGAREYLGYVLRDKKDLKTVFPNLYGESVAAPNKTPDEYIQEFRSRKRSGGPVKYQSAGLKNKPFDLRVNPYTTTAESTGTQTPVFQSKEDIEAAKVIGTAKEVFKIKSEGKENRPNPMEIYSKPVGYRNTEGFVYMLPTAEISTLSDKSYNELSEPEKQVYNAYRGKQILPYELAYNPNPTSRYNPWLGAVRKKDFLHWEDALRMVRDSGVETISNVPVEGENSESYNYQKDYFRAHADPNKNTIYVPPLPKSFWSASREWLPDPNAEYIKLIAAELAHLNLRNQLNSEDSFGQRALTNFRDFAHGPGKTYRFSNSKYNKLESQTDESRLERKAIEGEYPDETNYTTPKDLEYQTHFSPTGAEARQFYNYNFTGRFRPVNRQGGGKKPKYKAPKMY